MQAITRLMMIQVVGGNIMTKMNEMTIPDLYVALAKVQVRLDRYIMSEVEDQSSIIDGLNYYIVYVQVQRDIIQHIEVNIQRKKRAKLNGEIDLLLNGPK